jgi:hypothetical protein
MFEGAGEVSGDDGIATYSIEGLNRPLRIYTIDVITYHTGFFLQD